MPYVRDPNLDENEDQQAQGANAPQVQISGAAPDMDSGSGGAPAGGASGGAKAAKSTGSGYQNLDKYLSVNQPQQFGSQLTGKVQDQVSQAGQNMQSAAQSFTNKVQASGSAPSQEQVNQAIANPTQANAKQYQDWINQSYKGPESLEASGDDYNKYWSGTNEAQTKANLLGTESGRFSLLDSYFGKPSYNYGQKSLDNLLVQQSGIGEKAKDLQGQAAQLKSQGTEQAKTLQNQAAQKKSEVEQGAGGARQAIGVDQAGNVVTDPNAQGYGAIGQQYKAINDALASTNANRQAQLSQLQGNLGADRVSRDQLGMLGLSGGERLYNLNLNNYLKGGGALSREQVMTPEQQAQIRALSSMAGVTDDFAGNDLRAANNAYDFDTARFQSDLNAQKAAYLNKANQAASLGGGHLNEQQMQDYVKQANDYWTGYNTNPSQYDPMVADFYRQDLGKLNQLNSQYNLGRKLGLA